jgi:hypothetical protein
MVPMYPISPISFILFSFLYLSSFPSIPVPPIYDKNYSSPTLDEKLFTLFNILSNMAHLSYSS